MDTALGSTVHSVLQPAPAGVRTYNIDEKYSDVFTVSEDGSDDFLLQVWQGSTFQREGEGFTTSWEATIETGRHIPQFKKKEVGCWPGWLTGLVLMDAKSVSSVILRTPTWLGRHHEAIMSSPHLQLWPIFPKDQPPLPLPIQHNVLFPQDSTQSFGFLEVLYV